MLLQNYPEACTTFNRRHGNGADQLVVWAISLERSSYTVSENSGFVEVCTILNGLGVVEDVIIVDFLTESISATGKPALKVSAR